MGRIQILQVIVVSVALHSISHAREPIAVDISPHYQVRTIPGKLLGSRQHGQVFARSTSGAFEYLGSTLDPEWATKYSLGFKGLYAKNIALSQDGRSVVYDHNQNLAGRLSGKASGLYRHEIGIGERMLLSPNEYSISASRYPKPLPMDTLAINHGKTKKAMNASGEIIPILLVGGNSLHQAAVFADLSLMDRILSSQPFLLNATTYWDMTAVELAALSRNESIALELLQRGAEYHNEKGGGSLIFLASAYRNSRLVDALLQRKVNYRFEAEAGITPFHALLTFYTEHSLYPERVTDFDSFASTLDVYLKHGADIDLPDGKGRSLLHIAPRSSPSVADKIVAYLFEKGITPETKDNDGNTPLHAAVLISVDERNPNTWEHRKLLILRSIATRVRDIDSTNRMGVSPLQLAIQNNHIRTAEYLVSLGANADTPFIHDGLGPKIKGQSIKDRIQFTKKSEWWKEGIR